MIGGIILLIAGILGYVVLWFFGPDDTEELTYYGMVPYVAFMGGFLSIAMSL